MARSVRFASRLACAGLAALGLGGSAVPVGAAEPPNIVLIVIDMLRADRLGAYGYPAPSSPELDGFAQAGVRFGRVVAQSTWTRPSIASLLTSLHPRTLGLRMEDEHALDPRRQTLAEVLKSHGYWTAGATANPNTNSAFQFDQGFDHYIDSDVLFPGMPGQLEQKASGKKQTLARARGLLLEMLDYARKQPHGPGFLQVVLMDVHQYEKIPDSTGDSDAALADAESSAAGLRYSKAVRYVSAEIGLFIRSLTRLRGWEHTLVIVTSDHGETLGRDHASLADPKWHGFLVYETQALVPWIMYSSDGRLPAGRVIERPVRLLDLMPTVLDYAGIPAPKGIAGSSLMGLLRDEPTPVELPERFVVETRFRGRDKTAVYGDEWIYVENRDEHPGTSPRELQRVGVPADGTRTDNAQAHEAVLLELTAYLSDWRKRYPRAGPTLIGTEVSERAREQLRALGYID
ncbi:MAG: sulfatase [Myxococcota bacterium]